jgi:hypothetical protein
MKHLKFALHHLLKILGSPALLFTAAIALGANTTICAAASMQGPESNSNPRLIALMRDLQAGNRPLSKSSHLIQGIGGLLFFGAELMIPAASQ